VSLTNASLTLWPALSATYGRKKKEKKRKREAEVDRVKKEEAAAAPTPMEMMDVHDEADDDDIFGGVKFCSCYHYTVIHLLQP
jgi:hypothetical protein